MRFLRLIAELRTQPPPAPAITFSEQAPQRIILIDGEELAKLMIQYDTARACSEFSAAGAITLECKRAPRPLGFASGETLDDARPDIQMRRQE
jgi:hypothetical protein